MCGAQHEARKNLQDWVPSIKDELASLFGVKKALRVIDPAQVVQNLIFLLEVPPLLRCVLQ